MTDNTTRVIKLANGESIVCTCVPTRTDEDSDKLHIIQPLKMELKNRITKKGVVEALSLSRWLQPFTESDEFDIEKNDLIAIHDCARSFLPGDLLEDLIIEAKKYGSCSPVMKTKLISKSSFFIIWSFSSFISS